jgi:hypothetical protein
MVSIEEYDREYGNNDFNKLIKTKGYFDQDLFKILNNKRPNKKNKLVCEKESFYLIPSVMKWLSSSVKDDSKGNKSWCVGNDNSNSNGDMTYSIWFSRKKMLYYL